MKLQFKKSWKITLNILFITIAAFVIIYKVINHIELKTTSALFIGLPILTGLLIVNLTRTKTSYGMTVKISLILLCLIAPLLGEGSICILMMAPLFLAINLFIVFVYQKVKNKYLLFLMALLPFFSGLLERDSLSREREFSQVITETIVNGNPQEWRDRVGNSHALSKDIPPFLGLGFPLPTHISRDGHHLSIFFDKGGKWKVDRILKENSVHYSIVEDTSKIGHWVEIKDSYVEIITRTPLRVEGEVMIKQSTRYRSKVFPRWYFALFQKRAIEQMHQWAISSWKIKWSN